MPATKKTTASSAATAAPAAGAKRHRRVLRDNIQGLNQPALRRLCQRAGVTRMTSRVYEELRGITSVKLEELLRRAVVSLEHDGRKTLYVRDLEFAVEGTGMSLGLATHKSAPRAHPRPSKAHTSDKAHRWRAGTAALRDVRFQQKHSEGLVFGRLPFERYAREVAQDMHEDLRFSSGFLDQLQFVVEAYLVRVISNAYICTMHAKRISLMPSDLQVARSIMGDRGSW
jgi:histone H3